jgi:hypothetical protein
MVLLASDYDQSRFLNADDLNGGERKFKIKNVTVEEVGKEDKLIVWFTNSKKGLVLNKTNNRVLREKFGDDVAGWKEQIIILFSMMVPFQGRMTPGLRVRIPPPRQASTKPASSTTFMARGEETQPLSSNGPVAVKSANKKPANKKKPQARDELDEVIESQPPPQDSGDDDLNDDIDM